ncbi:MAG TPA: hypothetical protein VHB47_18135, partial [Thermoanaerobaculia bacterium]|nr:hypothetical protein [Thermoanaerobaculia bacterium]
MLPAMPRRLVLSLLGLALPIFSARSAQAAGLPCQPCAGIRLAAPLVIPAPVAPAAPAASPASGGAAATGSDAVVGAATPGAAPAPGPSGLLGLLRGERLPPGSPLFIAWEVPLAAGGGPAMAGTGSGAKPSTPPASGPPPQVPGPPAQPAQPASAAADDLTAAGAAARAVAAAGGTPWLSLVFSTPAPLARNLAQLQAELSAAAEVAAASPRGTWFQILWRPAPAATGAGTSGAVGAGAGAGAPAGAAAAGAQPPFAPAEYAFLLKRAAVAVSGAQANVHVATAPLPADPAIIAAFYGAEVAAYVDLVALSADPEDASRLAGAAQKVRELDPGRPLALDALPYPPAPAGAALAEAARQAAAGFDLTLFRAPGAAEVAAPGAPGAPGVPSGPGGPGAPAITAAMLNPLALLAREFAGDLSYDPGSAPAGAAEAWAFVRGKDLALRVIAVLPAAPGAPAAAGAPGAGGAETPALAAPVLHFADPDLRRPTRFPFATGAVAPPTGKITPPPHPGLDVLVPDPSPVIVLGIERLTAAERQGVAEKLTVASEREIPVEEILKRLQVFEEAQHRRLDDYTAINTTHLRFQPASGAASVEATLTGPFFWSRVEGADWAWESLYLNGVRWRGKTLPEIPLIQPEKAAALPLEILFTREY